MDVVFTKAETAHILFMFNERDWQDTEILEQQEAEGLRRKFIFAHLHPSDPVMFSFDTYELRALDMLLTDNDPRNGKLPSGEPVMVLVEKVWRAILGEEQNARNEDRDANLVTDEAGLTPVD